MDERQARIEDMFDDEGVLVSNDDVVLKRMTLPALREFRERSGRDEVFAPLLETASKDLRNKLRSSLAKSEAEEAKKPGQGCFFDARTGGLLGTFSLVYNHPENLGQVSLVSLDSTDPALSREAFGLLLAVARRTNRDQTLLATVSTVLFQDRALVEGYGGGIRRFVPTPGVPKADVQAFYETHTGLADEEVQGLAQGFGVDLPTFVMGTLEYEIPTDGHLRPVQDDRATPDHLGAELAHWVALDLTTRISAAYDLLLGGHILRGLKELLGAMRRLRAMSTNIPEGATRVNKALRVTRHLESVVRRMELDDEEISYQEIHELDREVQSLDSPKVDPRDIPDLFGDDQEDDAEF